MSSKAPQFDLNIRDKLDFPFRIDQQIETFQKATLNTTFSRREIEESINGLVSLMPTRWQDDPFKDDIKAAKAKVQKDVRPVFAGVRMNKDLCRERKIPMTKEVEVIDYFKMLRACIDLLDRLGMLSRREFTEAPTGMPFGEEALPEGMNLQEYVESLAEDPGDDTEDPDIVGEPEGEGEEP